jgi:uncharacterized repeat protein (TIGR01451 family)
VEEGTAGRTLTNRADISGDQPDPVGNNTDTASVYVEEGAGGTADLTVAKTVDSPQAQEGDIVEFTIVASNNGPDDATGVVVQDKLPAGFIYLSHTTNVGTYNPSTGEWNIGDLPRNYVQPSQLVIQAQVDERTLGQVLTNMATISGAQLDPDSSNNSASASVEVMVEDSDDDGLPDPEDPCPEDPDCDDDGVPDPQDPCPQNEGVFCSGVAPQVVITEVCWAGTLASPEDQWIELANLTDVDVSLAGWSLVISYPDGPDVSISLSGMVPAHGYYLLERGGDHVVADIPADLIFRVALPQEGGRLRLLSPDGMVLDLANPDGGPWPAGLAMEGLVASMERVDPTAPGYDENWKTNNTVTRYGVDATGAPINGTPKHENSWK